MGTRLPWLEALEARHEDDHRDQAKEEDEEIRPPLPEEGLVEAACVQLQCGLPQGVRRLVQLLRLSDKGGRGAEVSPSEEPLIVEEDAILGRRRP